MTVSQGGNMAGRGYCLTPTVTALTEWWNSPASMSWKPRGRKLQHCIASYGIKCLVSGSFIYALRDRLGNHISTFEIQFEMGRPVLQQHKGMLNQDPQLSEARAV